MKAINNISKNDLAKYQGMLDQIESDYTTSREGWHHANAEVKSRVNALKMLLVNLHQRSQKNDASDITFIDELTKRADKFDVEIRKLGPKEAKAKDVLLMRKNNVLKKLNELKSLHKK